MLLARIFFEPTAADAGYPHNADGQYITPAADLGFGVEDPRATLPVLGQLAMEVKGLPDCALWPVMYDVDDDGRIGFGDLAFFATAFQQKVGEPGADFAWACDFDHSGKVDVGDLAFFAENFQRAPGDPIVYPASFPDDWQSFTQQAPGVLRSPGPESLQAPHQASLADSALAASPDHLEADGEPDVKRARFRNEHLGYVGWALDYEELQPTAGERNDTKDVEEAVDFLITHGYW